MHQYKKLKVWQKAMNLTSSVYDHTKGFPLEERYGLTQQIRRSAVSIPSNIAEGSGRRSVKEFKYFLSIAYGSSCELETQLILANKYKYINQENYQLICAELIEIQKMIFRIVNNS